MHDILSLGINMSSNISVIMAVLFVLIVPLTIVLVLIRYANKQDAKRKNEEKDSINPEFLESPVWKETLKYIEIVSDEIYNTIISRGKNSFEGPRNCNTMSDCTFRYYKAGYIVWGEYKEFNPRLTGFEIVNKEKYLSLVGKEIKKTVESKNDDIEIISCVTYKEYGGYEGYSYDTDNPMLSISYNYPKKTQTPKRLYI